MGIYIPNRAVTTNFTRPSDTTAYAAGDVVCNSTSAPVIMTFTNASRNNGGGGIILDVVMVDSANQSTKGVFELWLFCTTVTMDNDNAVFTPTDAECATVEAIIPLGVSYVGDATSGAGGNAVYQSDQANRHYITASEDSNLYGILVVRNAYTPVSAEIFTVTLKILEDIR